MTETGKQTPLFTRFSTVAGNKGSKDTPRDVRGFAVKIYTEEGNWDIVGNNMPIFFIQDAIKFPDLIHAVNLSLIVASRKRRLLMIRFGTLCHYRPKPCIT